MSREQLDHFRRVKAATVKGAGVVAGSVFVGATSGSGIGYAVGDWIKNSIYGSVSNSGSSSDVSPASFETNDPYNVSSNNAPTFDQVYWYPLVGAVVGAVVGGAIGLVPSMFYLGHVIKGVILDNNLETANALERAGVDSETVKFVFGGNGVDDVFGGTDMPLEAESNSAPGYQTFR